MSSTRLLLVVLCNVYLCRFAALQAEEFNKILAVHEKGVLFEEADNIANGRGETINPLRGGCLRAKRSSRRGAISSPENQQASKALYHLDVRLVVKYTNNFLREG